MNYVLKNLPLRTEKPRNTGFTMAMDKGLSLRETEDFVDSCADYVDIAKFGWATSYVTKHLKEKIAGRSFARTRLCRKMAQSD